MLAGAISGRGLEVRTGTLTSRIEADPAGCRLVFAEGHSLTVDLVVVATGIRPRNELALASGLPTGAAGAIVVDDALPAGDATSYTTTGVYRLLWTERGRLMGALGVGPWPELGRLQRAVDAQRRVWPWQLARFERAGRLWAEELECRSGALCRSAGPGSPGLECRAGALCRSATQSG